MTQLPEPLTPPGCDLRDFPHTPLFRSRLFGSSFHARATDAEWRAGVTLWLKSWDQVPAGSLPNDDIELCRLAELARDLKAWRKHKAGALRGWIECSDLRLYHPVVAEGINNAIEHKVKQRLKTAKARIGALEKHLKTAVGEDKARITEEIRRIQQTLSQGLSQTTSQGLSLDPREGEGREKGITTVPDGTAGDAGKSPADMTKAELWSTGKSLLAEQGMPERQCGSFVGKLVKDYGDEIVIEAVRSTCVARPADAAEYLKALCLRAAGQRRPTSSATTTHDRRAATLAGLTNTGEHHADPDGRTIDVEAHVVG